MKLGIILETKEAEKAWNAFRFAVTAQKKGNEVKVFLMGEAVECESITEGKYNVNEQLNKFVAVNGHILACGTCLTSRKKEGTTMCPVSSLSDLYAIIKSSKIVLTF